MLTQTQEKIIRFIRSYISNNDSSPTLFEIQEFMGFSSKRAVTYHLEKLENKGYITHTGDARGIVIIQKDNLFTISVPIMGYANAGTPLLKAEDEYLGSIKIDKKLISSHKTIFAIQIVGDSMNKRKVSNNKLSNKNYAIISKNEIISNKDVVLALIDDCVTIKTYKKENNIIVLYPESNNPIHKPIYLHNDNHNKIIGKVICVMPH